MSPKKHKDYQLSAYGHSDNQADWNEEITIALVEMEKGQVV